MNVMKVTCIMCYKMMGRGQSRAGEIELKLLVSVGSRLHSIKRVVRVGPMEQKQVLEGCEIN